MSESKRQIQSFIQKAVGTHRLALLAGMPETFHSEACGAFIEWLIDARKRGGLTQAELARRLGRPQSFVSNYESRIRGLDIIETLVIARAIGLDPATVMTDLSILVGAGATI